MRFTDSDSADEPEINVISLIDVILVLLIFFMATATFENQSRVKLSLPEASEQISEADKGPSLVVQVTQDGRFFVGKSEVVQNTLDGVKAAIAQVAAGDVKQKVIIRADAQSQHQHVLLAMDALSQLGFSNLSIATVKPSAP